MSEGKALTKFLIGGTLLGLAGGAARYLFSGWSLKPGPRSGSAGESADCLSRATGRFIAGAGRKLLTDRGEHSPTRRAARLLNSGAATLSVSVLTDSFLEHYRGGFYNPAMYLPPAVSVLTLGASLSAAMGKSRHGPSPEMIFGVATLTGLVGLGFHIYNVAKRIGGVSWDNLFYGAPLAAPLALTFAGLFGLAAPRMRGPGGLQLGEVRGGPLISIGAALGLLGTAGEAGLLHFRGAFHDRFMYLPVTIPPLAGLTLVAAVLHPSQGLRTAARFMLEVTFALGLVGVGFHIYGVGRNMGGWKNWSQNLLNGPPIPAPPSFLGIAMAGLAGLFLESE